MRSTANEKLKDEIRNTEIFRNIDDRQIARFLSGITIRTYRDGHMLFFAGDICTSLYVILSGTVCLNFISEEGNEVIFSELQPGDVFGEIELTLNYRHSSTATIFRTTRLLEIDRKIFGEISQLPEISSFLLKSFARKLHNTMMFAEGMALYPLETRLARLLINMGSVHGRNIGDGILIEKPISQSRMGQLINASRSRINAQLQAWKTERLIGMRHNRIVIIDKRSLQIISRHSDPKA
ncbi:Crp/Fnr family transcriptional regulator [Rhizobium puerariae]|uniref:Crp/Fnr family transcriptional regulator n=1 Tax=Rhizobium puerariae TaxID=1585791 RepID=A0ABV6AM54_9HYPH